MIELAGEVADGAFLMVGLDPAGIRAARRHLEAGAARAGRRLDGFPVTYVVTLGLGADADVFLFPAHDLAGGYALPEAVLDAYARVIRPRLGP